MSLDINAFGVTDTGLMREENQDCIFVDSEIGLFLVLDGMGGHRGGATASRVGCQIIAEVVKRALGQQEPDQLLVDAIVAAGSRVHNDSKTDRDLHGMGTTAVAVLMPRPDLAIIAHVGDSRAYLLREGRLRRLTADHTIVAELVAAGRLTPEQAYDHPHASILSRNLGGLPTTHVEVGRLELHRGDRLLLCSDGLNGYATQGSIEQVLSGADHVANASKDLIELAKRGGGGDNVSVVVVEVGSQNQRRASSLDQSGIQTGSRAWWQRRALFLKTCQRMGLATSALAAGLVEAEALEILGGSFCEAVYHDLENTTGIHVWTYTDSLVRPWFARNGAYAPIKELFDILRSASLEVVQDLSAADGDFGCCLEIALLRSLIVGEMVIGGQLGTSIEVATEQHIALEPPAELPEATFASIATMPFAGLSSSMPTAPEVSRCLRQGLDAASTSLDAERNSQTRDILLAAHGSADEFAGDGEMASAAQDLYGNRLLTEQELNPILSTLDQCRLVHLSAVDAQPVAPKARATAYRSVALAHQSLFHAFALAAVDAAKPTTDRLREMHEATTKMRERVARNEQRLATLEADRDTLYKEEQ